MLADRWNVAVVVANRFEGAIIADLLRNTGAKAHLFLDSEGAHASLAGLDINLVIIAAGAQPLSGPDWVRRLRRDKACPARKCPVFIFTPQLTFSIVEMCRHAGANAAIGMPVSGAALLNTIRKVLAKPRPFIDSATYVGPCRRAGIVTAGAGSRRRKSDFEIVTSRSGKSAAAS